MARETKHTHGPWKVKTNVHPETNGDPWGWVGRDIFGSGDAIPGISITWTGRQGRVNAQLVAAAPEMLEMLQNIYNAVDWSSHAWDNDEGQKHKAELESLIKSIEG